MRGTFEAIVFYYTKVECVCYIWMSWLYTSKLNEETQGYYFVIPTTPHQKESLNSAKTVFSEIANVLSCQVHTPVTKPCTGEKVSGHFICGCHLVVSSGSVECKFVLDIVIPTKSFEESLKTWKKVAWTSLSVPFTKVMSADILLISFT